MALGLVVEKRVKNGGIVPIMALLDDVADYLEDQGLGEVGVDLFKSRMDDTGMPDQMTSLHEYAGAPPTHVLEAPGVHHEQPGLHVRCRAADYPTARAQAQAIMLALEEVNNQTLGSTRYLGIRAQQSPFPLEVDNAGRAIIVCNFLVLKEP